MKFLVDAQLPPSLARWIAAHDHEASHVFDIALHTASDAAIWVHAASEDRVLILGEIADIETIATGRGIRDLPRLRR